MILVLYIEASAYCDISPLLIQIFLFSLEFVVDVVT